MYLFRSEVGESNSQFRSLEGLDGMYVRDIYQIQLRMTRDSSSVGHKSYNNGIGFFAAKVKA
jgi:hypothetical protein